MSIGWYVHRLAAMSPGEIVHRVGEQVRRQTSRRKRYGWSAFPSPPAALTELPGLRKRLLDNTTPESKVAIIRASERVLSGEFAALGVEWPKRDPEALFPHALWRLDPVSSKLWPGAEAFCYDVSYRHERTFGDVKYVWEINRLQFLQPLAAAYALTKNPRALAAVEAAIVSWTEANPPFQGLGWNSGIEVALRAVSVLVAITLCAGDLGEDVVDRANGLLLASLHWLLRFPSGFSSANNHLVAEAMGEFLIAMAMPGLKDAERISGNAKAVLEREALLQILPDGVAAEQSPTYGAFTAEMLLLCALVAHETAPFDDKVGERLVAFADWIAWIADDTSATPAIGDDDEGRVLSLVEHETLYPASVVEAISAFYGCPTGMKTRAPASLRNAVFGSPLPAEGALAGLKSFPEGGYSVVRETRAGRSLQLIFDHGPLGYLSIAAHGHADALALILNLDGLPVFVDPGTYLYHSGDLWRDWFRGTQSHNTLSINSQDSSTISGPFNWSQKAKAQLRASDPAAWRLEGTHDGYRTRFGLDHHRTIEASPDGLIITDSLMEAPSHKSAAADKVDLTYQLAAGLTARLLGGQVIVSRSQTDLLSLAFPPNGEISMTEGMEDSAGGWVSPGFGVKSPATRVCWSGAPISGEMKTVLSVL